MTFDILLLTGEQIRAARALARIEQTDLARRASLSLETIKRLERIRGPVEANARTLRSIQRAFQAIGISFHGDDTGSVGISCQANARQLISNVDATDVPTGAVERLRRLIYHGRLAHPSGEGLRTVLANLHSKVTRLHKELGLTGLTLVVDGVVLQALEGPHEAVETAYQRLKSTQYHEHLSLMDDRQAGQRIFEDMGFCCGRFPVDGSQDGAHLIPTPPFQPDRLSATEAVAILMAARKKHQETPRNGTLTPATCSLQNQCLDTRCNHHPSTLRSPTYP